MPVLLSHLFINFLFILTHPFPCQTNFLVDLFQIRFRVFVFQNFCVMLSKKKYCTLRFFCYRCILSIFGTFWYIFTRFLSFFASIIKNRFTIFWYFFICLEFLRWRQRLLLAIASLTNIYLMLFSNIKRVLSLIYTTKCLLTIVIIMSLIALLVKILYLIIYSMEPLIKFVISKLKYMTFKLLHWIEASLIFHILK